MNPTTRQRNLEAIRMYIEQLNPDEVEHVAWLTKRLVAGAKVYGPLDLERDPREFVGESIEEGLDLMVYHVCKLLQIRRNLV